MKEFALVLSMWTHTGTEWVLSRQDVLKEDYHHEHCEFSSYEEVSDKNNGNKYLNVTIQCYPVSCTDKEMC